MKEIKIIPSKSFAHRAYICDYLSGGDGSGVACSLDSDDIRATVRCLDALRRGESDLTGSDIVLDCGESGSTLRFMLPLAGVLGRSVSFMTRGRLSERPMGPLEDELKAHGMEISHLQDGVIKACGSLVPGTYTLPGSISSQFITGLLLTLPKLSESSRIVLTSPLQSKGYVDITCSVLADYGVSISEHDGIYEIQGGQEYVRPGEYTVEGDWSQAAFWLVMGAIGKEPVAVSGLDPDSVQGDRAIVDILKQLGVRIERTEEDGARIERTEEDGACIEKAEEGGAEMAVAEIRDSLGDGAGSCTAVFKAYPSELHGEEIDVSEAPDLAPAIAAAAAFAAGESKLINAGRLRLKESDRIESIVRCLKDLGAAAEEYEDEILIYGANGSGPSGGIAHTAGDHRIVMMAAAMSAGTDWPVEIEGMEAVNKSYPSFFKELAEAGMDGNLVHKQMDRSF